MCGIGGILSKGKEDVPSQALEKMSLALRHRGPDDSGLFLSPDRKIGLVHRRLSIIDLSPEARQPMAENERGLQIVYNGEIYNYRALREDLLKEGYPFRTSSDTEVILALYKNDPHQFLNALRGMFAMAIWDEREKTLFLARDRMGIKPLYYADSGSFFIFGSEVRAILATNLVAHELSGEALSGYLSFGSIPTPHTLIRGIQSLKPAQCLLVQRGETRSRRYWEFHFGADDSRSESLQDTLKDAVSCHLVSDVPVGVFLSGGVDSTAITALMRAGTPNQIRSFSITFPNTSLDESRFAKIASRSFATSHIEKPVTSRDFARELPAILASMDQPTIDGINTYFVSQLARESGTKVVLSGLGGDELFGGYPSFRIVPRLVRAFGIAARIPAGLAVTSSILKWIPRNRKTESLSEFITHGGSAEAGYHAIRRLFPDKEKEKLASLSSANGFDPINYLRALVENGESLHPVDAVHLLEMRAYMLNQLLRDTDVMGMAHGVEVRVPLLDHILVENAIRMSIEARLGTHPKELLTKPLIGKVPSELYTRPKMGFAFPLEFWLKNDLRPTLDPFFQESPRNGIAPWIDWGEAKKVWQAFLSGRAHWSKPWAIYVLNQWVELNIG